MSVGVVNKETGDRIPTAGNPLDKVGNLAYLHTTAKSDAVSAINEVKDEQANKADNDIVADAFSAVETYAEGDYCTYEGGLYKFKASHSGAWDAADVDRIKIAGELSELKNTLGRLDWGHVEVITASTYTPTKPGQLIVSGVTTGINGYVAIKDNSADVLIANGYFSASGTYIACNALVVVGHTYGSGSYNATISQFLFVPFG